MLAFLLQVSVTENLEAAHTEDCAEARNSNESPESGGLTGIEVIAPIEKDENVEKAEAYMKQLENVSILHYLNIYLFINFLKKSKSISGITANQVLGNHCLNFILGVLMNL